MSEENKSEQVVEETQKDKVDEHHAVMDQPAATEQPSVKEEQPPVEEKKRRSKAPKKEAQKEEAPAEAPPVEGPLQAPATVPAEEPQLAVGTEAPAPADIGEEKKTKSRKQKKEEVQPIEQLVFGKFTTQGVVVEDPSLKAFINLDPIYVPHSSARHANKPFYKAKISVVERLINNLMRTERWTGKKTKSYRAVLQAFMIIQEKTKENPIQVLVKALENTAPREEVTRLKYGGISVPKAVDTAPSRRLDLALRNISTGSMKASHKNRKSIAQCLASELIAASKGDMQSFAVSKRDEAERVAKSAH